MSTAVVGTLTHSELPNFTPRSLRNDLPLSALAHRHLPVVRIAWLLESSRSTAENSLRRPIYDQQHDTTSLNKKNDLIDAMPRGLRKEFLGRCELVDLVFGDVLCETTQPMSYAYFPLSGFISRTYILDEHQPLEIGLIGNEGMLGETLLLNLAEAPMRAVVQGAGTALRMLATDVRLQVRRSGMPPILGRYLLLLIAQLARSSACTRFHEIEPRLARWLLMTHDRAHADHFQLTHEFLAAMLGVRRSGVSVAAGKLQRKKLIRYNRGEITVLDREGLEGAACTCYAVSVDHESSFSSIQ